MKYRRLSNEELKELENEFIEFLSANTITGNDWEKLKSDNPEKVNALIEQFSDIVLQKVLEKIKYLELRTPYDWKVFHCGKANISMIGLSISEFSELDLTKQITTADLSESGAEIYSGEKAYQGERESEIFGMLDIGCSIASPQVFEMMKKLMES
ncbi:MAG: DUF6495 family protein [Bacteroidota bacterium]